MASRGTTSARLSGHRYKVTFRKGLRDGPYAKVSDEPLRASFAERTDNPRARSAKLRWAAKQGDQDPRREVHELKSTFESDAGALS
ncbi:MAG: hypothetical protein ACJ8FY_16905 [Gemmataceae bacterium]